MDIADVGSPLDMAFLREDPFGDAAGAHGQDVAGLLHDVRSLR